MIYQRAGGLPLAHSEPLTAGWQELAIEHHADSLHPDDRLHVEDAHGWAAPRVRLELDANPPAA